MASKLQSSSTSQGASHEEIRKRVWNSPAVQLDDDRRPEHDNASSGWSTRSIKAREGSAAETAAEETQKEREETGHSTAEPGNAATTVAKTVEPSFLARGRGTESSRNCAVLNSFRPCRVLF